MTEQKKRVVSLGEVMIEMSRGPDGRFGLACGGDTFNTAVYLARNGIDVAYATALGDDPYSDGILAVASAEGFGTDLMLRVPGRMPGVYLIETGTAGLLIVGAPAYTQQLFAGLVLILATIGARFRRGGATGR